MFVASSLRRAASSRYGGGVGFVCVLCFMDREKFSLSSSVARRDGLGS